MADGPNDHRCGPAPTPDSRGGLAANPPAGSPFQEANTMTAPLPTTRFARRATSLIAGALLLLLVAQPVLAVEWGSAVRLSSMETYQPRLFRTGPERSLRSTSAARPPTLGGAVTAERPGPRRSRSRPASESTFAASAYGSKVDIAYVRQTTSPTGGKAYRLFYRRSLDGGATWETARPVTSSTSNIADQAIARHPNGRVSIAWTGYTTGRLYLRTSADGGGTFGPARYIGTTSNWEPGVYPFYRSDPAIAIGTGVTYVAYLSAATHDVGPAHDGPGRDMVVTDAGSIARRMRASPSWRRAAARCSPIPRRHPGR